jgi:nucleoside-diphosphate-sugar epimerase
MVATLDTGLNLVHVADVARGHLLAAQRGHVGEKYILGCQNRSLTEIFHMLLRHHFLRTCFRYAAASPRWASLQPSRQPLGLRGFAMDHSADGHRCKG